MKRFALLLLVVAAGLAVASLGVSNTAATVNGAAISQSSLDADLTAIAASPQYQCFLGVQHILNSGPGAPAILPVNGVGGTPDSSSPATYNTAFVRFWLSQMMENEVVSQQLARHGIALTSVDRTEGRATWLLQIQGALTTYEQETGSAVCDDSAADIVATLPPAFVAEQAMAQADQDALLAWAAGYSLRSGDLQRFYEQHRRQFDTVCLSAIEESSQSVAEAALAKVKAGTPFDQVGSASSAGCEIASGLPTSLSGLAAGQVGPVLSQGNGTYVLVQATSRTPTSFAKAKTQVQEALLVAGEGKTSVLLRAATGRKQATADPRYGRVVPGTTLLALPKSPPADTMLSAAANTTPVSSSASSSASPAGEPAGGASSGSTG